jgi:hypothetical protein
MVLNLVPLSGPCLRPGPYPGPDPGPNPYPYLLLLFALVLVLVPVCILVLVHVLVLNLFPVLVFELVMWRQGCGKYLFPHQSPFSTAGLPAALKAAASGEDREKDPARLYYYK